MSELVRTTPQAAPTSRDVTIDAIRGLAVVSMIISHSSDGSLLFKVTHALRWVDGAEMFVLLAGLVLGIVHRRSPGMRSSVRRIGKRAAVVYAVHVLVVVVALVTLVPPIRPPSPAELGGWPSALAAALTLRLNPTQFGFLSTYVFLFGATVVGIALLRRGWTAVLAAGSVAVYAVAETWPHVFSLPQYPGGPPGALNPGTWQLLWISGLIAGWFWRERRVDRLLQRGWIVAVAAVGLVVVAGAGHLVGRIGVPVAWWPSVVEVVYWTLDKDLDGPGCIALAWFLLVVLYRIGMADTRPGTLLRPPLAAIGRRSLDSLVILSFTLVTLPVVVPSAPTSPTAMLLAVAIVVACWAWARLRGPATLAELPARLRWVILRRGERPAVRAASGRR